MRVAGGSASGAGDGGDATAGGAAGAGTGLPADGVAALGSLAAASEGFAASLQPQGTRRPSHASNNVAAASPLARSVAVRLSPEARRAQAVAEALQRQLDTLVARPDRLVRAHALGAAAAAPVAADALAVDNHARAP